MLEQCFTDKRQRRSRAISHTVLVHTRARDKDTWEGDPSKWLFLKEINGLDATKLADITKKKGGEEDTRTDAEKTVAKASIDGDRKTLQADSFIPAVMAVIYLLLFFYFKAIGGYKPVTIEESEGK